jgi:glucose-6-phosphate isomerase
MKKLISLIFFLTLSLAVVAGESITPLDRNTIKNMNDEQRQARVNVLENRLREFEAMDLKALEKADKKEIKKEVKDINRELKKHQVSGGVYIGIGALIVLVILLILLL